MSSEPLSRTGPAFWGWKPIETNRPVSLIHWLTLAALADWLITRTLLRLAIFAPKSPPVIAVYQTFSLTGQLATSLVSLLGLGMLGWIAWHDWQTRRTLWLPLVLLSQVMFSLIFLVVTPSGWWIIGPHLLNVLAAGMIALRARQAVVLLPMLALLVSRFYQMLPALYTAWQWPGPPPLTEALFNLGELLVVLSSVGFWWAFGRGASRRDWLAAACPALVFSALYLVNPAMTGILAIWSIGLTLYLPWPFYAMSLWLAGVAVITSLRRGNLAGWAILLLAAGGYAPQLSAQAFLSLIALWLLGGEASAHLDRDTL